MLITFTIDIFFIYSVPEIFSVEADILYVDRFLDII